MTLTFHKFTNYAKCPYAKCTYIMPNGFMLNDPLPLTFQNLNRSVFSIEFYRITLICGETISVNYCSNCDGPSERHLYK